ncbi:hypothetical protein Daus18300_010013 [Diaporthe australafricana]|uniref:Uncharacterized protein n=1 Tax=Diaporthe australafricana TaxID=127596 RepID=A0ABR3WCD2_9PEZI
MMSLGPFILLAGVIIVVCICWAWLPFSLMAKFVRLFKRSDRDPTLLPVRAAAGEVRYRHEGFVPPPQVLRSNPHAFDPEVRHHNYLRADPRKAGRTNINFQSREAQDASEAALGLGIRRNSGDGFERQSVSGASGSRSRSGEQQRRRTQLADRGSESGVQRPALTLRQDRRREREQEESDRFQAGNLI